MSITFLINQKAKKSIREIIRDRPDPDPYFIKIIGGWLKELGTVKCYILYENGVAKNIALLAKCDFDPENIHINPCSLRYIYTFPEFRRTGLAHKMLSHIKTREQTTAFCYNKESRNLFDKAGYNISKAKYVDAPASMIYRFP